MIHVRENNNTIPFSHPKYAGLALLTCLTLVLDVPYQPASFLLVPSSHSLVSHVTWYQSLVASSPASMDHFSHWWTARVRMIFTPSDRFSLSSLNLLSVPSNTPNKRCPRRLLSVDISSRGFFAWMEVKVVSSMSSLAQVSIYLLQSLYRQLLFLCCCRYVQRLDR